MPLRELVSRMAGTLRISAEQAGKVLKNADAIKQPASGTAFKSRLGRLGGRAWVGVRAFLDEKGRVSFRYSMGTGPIV